MSWLTRLTSSVLTRTAVAALTVRSYFVDNISPQDPYMAMLFGAGVKTKAGQFVSEDAALKLAPFFSACSLIASSMASMPLSIIAREHYEGDKEDDHYINNLLTVRPNPIHTPYSLVEWTMWRVLIKGNGYWLIDRDEENLNKIDAFWPIEPDAIKVYLDDDGKKCYEYTYKVSDTRTETVIYDNSEIIHIPGFMYDGLKGYSLLDFARESVGTGLAVDEFGAKFFSGDWVATGVITHPQRLKKDAKINIKESYREQSKGVETSSNSGGRGVMVLDEGMTYAKTAMSPEEGQFLGTRAFTVEEFCRWLHIPLYMMAVNSTGATMSAEEQYQFFCNFGLKPWTDRFTQELNFKVLSRHDRKSYRAAFDTNALTLLTADRQMSVFREKRNLGLLTLNNISSALGDNLLRGGAGDQRIAPSTMKVLGDTDPSTPVPLQTLTGFIDVIRADRNMTEEAALAMAELLMPTADPKLIKTIIEATLGSPVNQGNNNGGNNNGNRNGTGNSGNAGNGNQGASNDVRSGQAGNQGAGK